MRIKTYIRQQIWDEFTNNKIGVARVLAYAQVVRAATDAYLASLTAAELERQVYLFERALPVADVLTTLVIHSIFHAGEITAVKGIQGVKGLPY